MSGFRILPGLPATGAVPEAFPRSFAKLGREGFVVEFHPDRARSWIGNFAGGISSFSGVYQHPDMKRLLVVASGQGYVIDPDAVALLEEVGGAIAGVTELAVPPSLLLDHQGIRFERIGARGQLWRSRRLSWDGFRNVQVTGDKILGLGWDAPRGEWKPFELDVRTGRTATAVYRGPDLTDGERLASSDGAAA